jgi:outer membrane protein TolC
MASDTLLNEARRTTQSMIRNGIALPSAMARIDNQIAVVKAQQIDASANYENATSYYQFIIGDTEQQQQPELPELPDINAITMGLREEIDQINQGIKIQQLAIQKEDQFYLPRIGVQVDGGSQAFDFGFQPYVLAGLNLEVNIFDSNRHKYRKEAAKTDIISAEYQKDYVNEQIALQSSVAKTNLKSAIEQAYTFRTRIASVDRIYSEVFKKYKEGSTNYLELLDAQTQITQMNIQYLLARQNAWTKWAEYLYAVAAFPID